MTTHKETQREECTQKPKDRFLRTCLILLLICVVLLLWKVRYDLHILQTEKQAIEARIAQLRTENAQKQAELDAPVDRAYIESQARKRGYVYPEELPDAQ